jgi:hypothetical protein
MAKNKGGRPTKMTPEAVAKLEEAFVNNCTDTEACLYADISRTTLFRYEEKNPEYRNRKEELRSKPRMKAKFNISNKLNEGCIDTSKFVLTHTDPDYKPKSAQDIKHDMSKGLLDAIRAKRGCKEGCDE